MGEVYRAYDRRLDRRVALKIIRPDARTGLKARERFRREARAVAGLSHPTIVQIHDIIEREEGDGIVMELVEGETLARILQRGPLALDRALRLAREIAEGLAVAHGRGVVHRDLKAENVMITAEDRPKILDFGLAKRLFAPTPEQSLSIEGRVVGTGHAMSPEQAQGFRVDHRSDLFSFGTLLYEMVTGTSPFRRPTLAETLTRVCVHRQTSVGELRPVVPAELSQLIDRLLAKEPEDRPSDAAEVVGVLRRLEPGVSGSADPYSQTTLVDLPPASATGAPAATGGPPAAEDTPAATGEGEASPPAAASESRWYSAIHLARRPVAWGSVLGLLALTLAAVLLMRPNPPPPLRVAVTEVEVATEQRDRALLASGARVAILQTLLDLQRVHAVAPDEVDAVQGSAQEIARAMAADEVLSSRLVCEGIRCQMTVDRVAPDGRLVSTDSFRAAIDDLLVLSTTIREELRRVYDPYPLRPGAEKLEVSSRDYERYLELRLAFVSREDPVTLDRLLEQLAEVRRSSPRFVPVYLLEAAVARSRFLESRDSRHLERALRLAQEARDLAPQAPEPLRSLFNVALDSNQLDLAEEALTELERLEPTSPETLALRAVLLERRGSATEALDKMQLAVRRNPSTSNLFRLANMEVQNGALEAARQHLHQLLTIHPTNFTAQKVLALVELLSGAPDKAAVLYEELAQRSPESRVLNNLGIAQTLLKRYEAAVASFERALVGAPQSAGIRLNLADAKLLLGREAEAKEEYQKVLDRLAEDPAAATWSSELIRAQALAHLGRHREAVTAAQEALRRAPDSPQAALEAAIVYAVCGETASALANVERALALGVEPVWFQSPWFDSLRSHPGFRDVVSPHDTMEQEPLGTERSDPKVTD